MVTLPLGPGPDVQKGTRKAQEQFRARTTTQREQLQPGQKPGEGKMVDVRNLSGLNPDEMAGLVEAIYGGGAQQGQTSRPIAELLGIPALPESQPGVTGFGSLGIEDRMMALRRAAASARQRGDEEMALGIEDEINRLRNVTFPAVRDLSFQDEGPPNRFPTAANLANLGVGLVPDPTARMMPQTFTPTGNVFDDRRISSLARAARTGQKPTQPVSDFFNQNIRLMAGGGQINQPTMAIVGEKGPELASLQPGDFILPLVGNQADKLSKIPGVKSAQGGLGIGEVGRGLGKPRIPLGALLDIKPGPGFRPSARMPVPQTEIEQAMPSIPEDTTAMRGSLYSQYQPSIPPSAGPGIGFDVRSEGLDPGRLPEDPLVATPDTKVADASGIDALALLRAARTGTTTPSQMNELYTAIADLRGDRTLLQSELASLMEFPDPTPQQSARIIELKKELSDVVSKEEALNMIGQRAQNLMTAASGREATTLAYERGEEARLARAGITEKQRQEDYERGLAQSELQYQRALEQEERRLGRVVERQEGVANLVTQLFNSIGITIPENAQSALTSENLPSLLSTFLNIRQRQQQELNRPPQALQLGFG